MDDWLAFILARYNYWIVITLMMTGLYIVFARGNLVKKIVGLNIFQTSVFIYYITIGKIAGGTAPIYMGGELDAAAHHEPEAEHGAEAGVEGAHDANEALHAKIDNTALDAGNSLKDALKHAPAQSEEAAESLHAVPDAGDKISNSALSHLDKTPPKPGLELTPDGVQGAHDAAANAGHGAADAVHGAVEAIVYSNPLPHVLILTAIVVGVATTAVGLALAVRIREAYGTIEEDELEAADEIAEFGHQASGEGAPA
ncbi:sodium:proton antiporter [Hyphococcus sp.]|uniref:sodium:proton antiporter n=1 Tax=Hyphococcus sp. TaxID=2038636 RepID=UPI00207E5139|nr:MAG: sodium:proton antiporter [Marinicaulis sp.]